jgi:hypothetical protein
VGFNVTPEQIQAFEAARKAKAAENQREWEQAQAQRQQQQAYIKAKVNAAHMNEIKTANEELTCDNCGKPISEGTQYRRQNILVKVDWPTNKYEYANKHLVCVINHYCTLFEECGNTQSAMCTNKAARETYRDCGVYKKKSEASA